MALDRIPPALVAGGTDAAVARSWLAAAHAWLRERPTLGTGLGVLRPPGPGWNYYAVTVTGAAGECRQLVVNAAGRLAAAAHDDEQPVPGPLGFVDLPSPGPFVAAGFTVLTADELRTALTADHLAMLSTQELADVAYHRPTRAGDLVFNWFD